MRREHPRSRRELARLIRDEHVYRKDRLAWFEQRGERRCIGSAFRERVESANRYKHEWNAGRDCLNRQIVPNVRRSDSKRFPDTLAIVTLRPELRLAMRHPDEVRITANTLDGNSHRSDSEMQRRIDGRRLERDVAATREHPGRADCGMPGHRHFMLRREDPDAPRAC